MRNVLKESELNNTVENMERGEVHGEVESVVKEWE